MRNPGDTASSMLRVAVVDDYQMVLDGIITHLRSGHAGLDVVIAATSWAELVSHSEYPADVTVLDLNLGDYLRIESKVKALVVAGSAVIVISRHTSAAAIHRAIESGALGYVPKSAPADELIAAVRAVAAGRRYVSELYEPVGVVPTSESVPSIGSQEHRALVLYAAGRSIREVAAQLDTTEETAKSYVKRARSKYRKAGIDLGTRVLLRRYALLEGWIEHD